MEVHREEGGERNFFWNKARGWGVEVARGDGRGCGWFECV